MCKLTCFANCRQLAVTGDVVPLATVTVYVEAILVTPVVWLTANPRRVRQHLARYVRDKLSLLRHVSAVDEYKVAWNIASVCKQDL